MAKDSSGPGAGLKLCVASLMRALKITSCCSPTLGLKNPLLDMRGSCTLRQFFSTDGTHVEHHPFVYAMWMTDDETSHLVPHLLRFVPLLAV